MSGLPHVFPFVLLIDEQIAPVRLEVVDLDGAVSVVLDRERRINHTGDIVFPTRDSITKN